MAPLNATRSIKSGLLDVSGIHRRGPRRSFGAVEFATPEWVYWFNHRRLLEPIGNIPPQKPNNDTMPCWMTSSWLRNLNQINSGDPWAFQLSPVTLSIAAGSQSADTMADCEYTGASPIEVDQPCADDLNPLL